MKLYIGGCCQGQRELAEAENPGKPVIGDFHLTVRKLLKEGGDVPSYVSRLCEEQPDAVIVSDEIGSGIVPLDPFERAWREAAGRALCTVAAHSDQVTRVICGIGVRIK